MSKRVCSGMEVCTCQADVRQYTAFTNLPPTAQHQISLAKCGDSFRDRSRDRSFDGFFVEPELAFLKPCGCQGSMPRQDTEVN